MKKTIATILAMVFVFCLAACSKTDTVEVNSYEYNNQTTADASATTAVAVSGDTANKNFTVDDSWQKNYRVTYRYYNSETDTVSATVRETAVDNAFAVEYLNASPVTMYYKASGGNTDFYTISASEQTHTLLSGKNFSSLKSLFMKLTTVDEGLSKQANVIYMKDETVAGRNCQEYIQRAYTNGEVTETVYVWIDSQYGFSAKCQATDAQGTLTMSWEITSFETGNIKESDIGIDLSSYNFTEVNE